ncbi:unnamed protein product [Rotaria magnacalcarata]|uniref:Innexin n=2 Tax=Rotaria magnacalcarata TaxID=392030 RepID=A0A814ZG16_9BILA|nr:unnamed protein product [Rotaria magnacalcarata]CAF1242692.1 unnamed protein product [Rotaria magnacalcarata]CAF2091506.1 unnamed protein product [Rotaria magnacalcarata]CAF3848128.1 unnamed protein product [Rotaria magnacalcarata]CAF3948968.1 unnamed protein product [Rotaria magnacalcarata]
MSGLILKAANDFSVYFLGTSRSDDSTGDRLSYRYTCAILVAFTILVSNRDFTMQRIQCWVPAFFNKNYEDYTNNVCWVRNTYYIDDAKEIPENHDVRIESSIRYYQWIPFILLFQALFFFLPFVLWRALSQRSGIDVRDVVEAATNYKKTTGASDREQLMNYMVSIIDQYIDDPRRQSNNREQVWWKKCIFVCFPSSGRYMGDYLRNLFIFIKIIYAINVFAQIFILSFLLSQPFWSLGFTILEALYNGRGWDYQSRYFPKVTLCDFQIREANALPIAHTYTVMCVLPINLFNQQIFTFLWFWFVVVILFTIYDLLIWTYRLFLRREVYLIGRLKIMNRELAQKWPYKDSCANHINEEENEHMIKVQERDESATTGDQVYVLCNGEKVHHQSRMFIVPRIYYKNNRSLFHFFNSEYLEPDGHFILRIIATNASDFVATKLLHCLYESCCKKRFRANEVQKETPAPRTTLYKYLIIPKEEPAPRQLRLDQPTTMNNETQLTTDSSAPPLLPRSVRKESQLSEKSDAKTPHRPSRRSRSVPKPDKE